MLRVGFVTAGLQGPSPGQEGCQAGRGWFTDTSIHSVLNSWSGSCVPGAVLDLRDSRGSHPRGDM